MSNCEYWVETFSSADDMFKWFEPSWCDKLTVRPVHAKLMDPAEVDWFEVEKYFIGDGTGGECLMSAMVSDLLSRPTADPQSIIEGASIFEYMLVGCSSTLDRDVGQTYTFTPMSFPVLRTVLQSQGDVVSVPRKTTMDLPPLGYDTDSRGVLVSVDMSSLGASYPPTALHMAPTLAFRCPLGNSISYTCGIYAMPQALKVKMAEAAALYAGLSKL